jgi:hypothetical protein
MTVLSRLIQARRGIRLINQYIADGDFMKYVRKLHFRHTTHWTSRLQTFIESLPHGEFEAVAQNLNISSTDPIRKNGLL